MEIRRCIRFERIEPYPYEYDSFVTEYAMEDMEYEADEIEKVNWNDYKETILEFWNDINTNDTPESPEIWKIIVQFAVAKDDWWFPMEKYDCEESLDVILEDLI